jgi:hypothetical protein
LICDSGYHADGDQCVPTVHHRRHDRAEHRVPTHEPSQAIKDLPKGVKIGCPPAVQPCQ